MASLGYPLGFHVAIRVHRVSFRLSCSYKGAPWLEGGFIGFHLGFHVATKGGLRVGVGLAMVSFLICFGYGEKVVDIPGGLTRPLTAGFVQSLVGSAEAGPKLKPQTKP